MIGMLSVSSLARCKEEAVALGGDLPLTRESVHVSMQLTRRRNYYARGKSQIRFCQSAVHADLAFPERTGRGFVGRTRGEHLVER